MNDFDTNLNLYFIRSLQRDILFVKSNCSEETQKSHPVISLEKMIKDRDKKLKELETIINKSLYQKFYEIGKISNSYKKNLNTKPTLKDFVLIINKLIKDKLYG